MLKETDWNVCICYNTHIFLRFHDVHCNSYFKMVLLFRWVNYCIPCAFIAYCENVHRWRVVPGHYCNTTAPLTRITKCPLWRIVASRPEHTLLQEALFHISNYVGSKYWRDKCDFTFSPKYVIIITDSVRENSINYYGKPYKPSKENFSDTSEEVGTM